MVVEEKKQVKKLFKDRRRTNILCRPEQFVVSFLVKKIPQWISSDMLTGIGLIGSFIVFSGFIMGKYSDRNFLFLCIAGLMINWFGDSLDGRMAYYRDSPRKWYGFSLDIIMDWIGAVLIGMGYFFYAKEGYEVVAFIFVVLYGWAMIISQLRYKITGEYTIDAGLVGPTEIRVVLSLIILAEIIFFETMQYFAAAICVVLFFINISDTKKLLKMGNDRDAMEKKAKDLI
jgi:hypothetical protein